KHLEDIGQDLRGFRGNLWHNQERHCSVDKAIHGTCLLRGSGRWRIVFWKRIPAVDKQGCGSAHQKRRRFPRQWRNRVRVLSFAPFLLMMQGHKQIGTSFVCILGSAREYAPDWLACIVQNIPVTSRSSYACIPGFFVFLRGWNDGAVAVPSFWLCA